MRELPNEINTSVTRLLEMIYDLDQRMKELKPVYDMYLKMKNYKKKCQKDLSDFYELIS